MKSLPRPFAALLVVLLASSLSCATTGPPSPPSQPAAREALDPSLRLFYDALVDYGDWTLIEPYGYVFRPAINNPDWQPYEDGFWSPTDSYGWVWISAEPFGWATYHYGTWFYDRFQGWVWLPGADWGPAWVAWEQSDNYVGWAPAAQNGGQFVPTGPFVYAPISSLGNTQVRAAIVKKDQLGAEANRLESATNPEPREGVTVPLGPSIVRLERRLGVTLQRTRIEDVLPSGTPTRSTQRGSAGAAGNPLIETTRRAGEDQARQARVLTERPAHAPAKLPMLRLGKDSAGPRKNPLTRGARDSTAADSTRK